MFRFYYPRQRAMAILLAISIPGLAYCSIAWARPDPPAISATANHGEPSQNALRQQAQHFWQLIAAKPDARSALLNRYFDGDMIKRNGEASLLESISSLAEILGPDMAALAPSKVLLNGRDAELHYTLADGRRIMLMLSLTDKDPSKIAKFGVRPLAPVVAAVKPEQLSATIAARINADFEAQRFSGAVLVARGEHLIHAQAIGLADRKTGRPNTLDTPINLGSINKMFTAIAIAQLQAAGKLDWPGNVGKYLPTLPNAKIRDQVTIHQLLTHTSGVASYWNDAYTTNKDHIDSQQEFLDTFVDQPLSFEPGKGLEYSNGGPVILGLIIEALSGSDYYDYVRQHIYGPAGMKHADHYKRDDNKAGIAQGYLKNAQGQWQDNSEDLGLRGSAAGGGYASARDLYAFARALRKETLLSRQQLEVLWKPYSQPGPIGYGYLFAVGNSAGKRWIGHDGGAPGISAEFMYYPDDGLVIIVLANQDNAAMPLREWLHALLEASLFKNS